MLNFTLNTFNVGCQVFDIALNNIEAFRVEASRNAPGLWMMELS